MSTPVSQETLRLEIIDSLNDSSPRAAELAELYLSSMGGLDSYNPDLVADTVDDMKGATFVTLIDDSERVVSMGGLIQPLGSPEGIITNVATDPEHQGNGLGSTVIEKLVEIAEHEGLERLGLSPTPRSIDFYARLGFNATKSPEWRIKNLTPR